MAVAEWNVMKFFITMHMPSNLVARGPDTTQKLVHQMIVEHPGTKTLEEFRALLDDNNFIIITEYYKDNRDPRSALQSQGDVLLNTMHIGKAKPYEERG